MEMHCQILYKRYHHHHFFLHYPPLLILSSMSSILSSATAIATAEAVAPVALSAVAGFPFSGNLSTAGMVQFAANPNGGVTVNLDLTKLPKDGGDFSYRIHEQPVAWNSDNCDGAGPMFDPLRRGLIDCDAAGNDALCAVGDLSGKHGKFHSTCYQTTFDDPYLSLDPLSPNYIVGRSLVVFHNNAPLACATIAYADSLVVEGQGEGEQCQPDPETPEEELPEEDAPEEEVPQEETPEVPEVPEFEESKGSMVQVSVMAAVMAAVAMM